MGYVTVSKLVMRIGVLSGLGGLALWYLKQSEPVLSVNDRATAEFDRQMWWARRLRKLPATRARAAQAADRAFRVASTQEQIRLLIDYWAEDTSKRDQDA